MINQERRAAKLPAGLRKLKCSAPILRLFHSGMVCLLILTFCCQAMAFQKSPGTIKGRVTDSKGEALPGVTVRLEGVTTKSQITDSKGAFIFNNVEAGTYNLVFNYISFKTVSKKVSLADGAESLQNVVLTEESSNLNEVVVIGYGTVKKADLTGSVSRISAKDINATPIVALDRALQGRVTGVNVTTNSGKPGSGTTIRIRGAGSINAGNNPLYVVDGLPVSDLNSINPGDIETIDILKDASSTAIYGSRGNNGVVIVTTKRGKSGKATLSYDGYYGSQSTLRIIPMLNAVQFAEMVNEAKVNANQPIYFDGSAEDRPLVSSLSEGTNWQNEVFQKGAPMQNHQLSVIGGSDQVRYAISGGYYAQDGIIKGSDFNRYSLKANVDGNINSWLKAGVNLYGAYTTGSNARTEVNGNAGGGVVSAALNYSPTFPVYNSAGTYYTNTGSINGYAVDNPVALVNEWTDRDRGVRVLANTFLEFKILNGLTFKTTLGSDISSAKSNVYATRFLTAGTGNGSASVSNNQVVSWLNENTLSYSKIFADKHSFNALAGYTSQAWERENFTANAKGFINDFALYNNLGTGTTLTAPASGASETSLQSFLGRVNYTYDNKYLLTVSARADGSSRFGPDSRWGYFPSAAFAWKIVEENFMKAQKVLSDAKIRVGYGLGGNQDIGDYQYVATLASGGYILGNTLYSGTTNAVLPNPDLRWEKSAQFDLGVDLGFFQNRVRLTADYYRKETSDLLFDVGINPSSGFSTVFKNIGGVENKGFELELSTNLQRRDFIWESQLSFSTNKSKVLALNNLNEIVVGGDIRDVGNGQLNAALLKVGDPMGQFYGLVFDGIFQTAEEIAVSAQKSAKPGDVRYRDLNGDGEITTDTKDRAVIGNANPNFFGGFNNTFTWKNIDLNVFLQGSYGNDILNVARFDLFGLNGLSNNSAEVLNRWTPTNPSNTIPRANALGTNRTVSSFLVEDGSYLRLKNVSLGYKFMSDVLKRAGIGSARVYVSAQNLATITNYSGFDPDVNRLGSGSGSTQGVDYGVYPSSKTFLLGLNFTF